MRQTKQSTARNVLVFMTDSADHVAGKTGLTLTITASKDGGAFGAITPTVTERGNGWYNLALTTAHLDTLGDFGLHVTGTGADPTDLLLEVVAYDPNAATNLGLTRIDENVSAAKTLTAGAVDAIHDEVDEPGGSVTLRQAIMALVAVLSGRATGFPGAGAKVFKNPTNTKSRVTNTTDADGNRTADPTFDFS